MFGDRVDELRAKAEVKGFARGLMLVVEARGMTLTENQRARVTECQDLDLLDQWLTRAVTATKPEDIFDD